MLALPDPSEVIVVARIPMLVSPPSVFSPEEDIDRFIESMRRHRRDPKYADDADALAFFDELIADALAIPEKRADLDRRVQEHIATHGSSFTINPDGSDQ